MTSTGTRARERRWWILLPTVALMVLGSCWALASPPGSAADDDFHLTSIWCAWGASQTCVQGISGGEVYVPEAVAKAPCFAFDAQNNASCSVALTNNMVPTERVNPERGGYPPLFYQAMRVFVGSDVNRSVILMRLANVLIAAILLGLALATTKRVARRAVAAAWLVTLIPTGIYFIASTNPSSWVITGIGLFWAFALTWLTEPSWRSRRSWVASIGMAVTGLLAVGARSDAAFYLLLSVVAVVIVGLPSARKRLRHAWILVIPVGLIGLALLFKAGTYLSWRPSFPGANLTNDQPNAVVKLLLEFPAFLYGVVGGQGPVWSQRDASFNTQLEGFTWTGYVFGVGWNDVYNPSLAGVFVAVSIVGVFFAGMSRYSFRKVAAVLLLVGAMVAQIVYMRALVGFDSIWALQPRYFIPFVILIVGVAAISHPWSHRLLNAFQGFLVTALMVVAGGVSFVATMARYTHGQTFSFSNLDLAPGWWWPTGPSPQILMVVAAISGLVYFGSLGWQVMEPRRGAAPALRTSGRPSRLASKEEVDA